MEYYHVGCLWVILISRDLESMAWLSGRLPYRSWSHKERLFRLTAIDCGSRDLKFIVDLTKGSGWVLTL